MDIITHDCDWRELPKERNYLLLKEKRMIYNQHKNTRYTESKNIVEQLDLTDYPEMLQIIELYVENLPYANRAGNNLVLLSERNGVRWERTDLITRALTRIAGKTMGSNALRHIIAENSAPSREQLDEMKAQAERMGHSLYAHMNIYIKKTTT
jgi:hypothetical protein